MSNVSSLAYRSVFGINNNIKPNVILASSETLIYASGNTIVSHSLNSSLGKIQQKIFLPPEEFSEGVSAIAFVDGKRNVAFSDNSPQPSICIFDLNSLHTINYLHLGEDFGSTGLISLSFSEDGHYLLAQGRRPNWALVIFSLETNQRISSIKTSEDETPVTQCTFSPGKNPLIAVTGDNIFKIYKLDQGKLNEIIYPNPRIGNILCHLWLNENILICSDSSGNIHSVLNECKFNFNESKNFNSPIISMAKFKRGFITGSEGGYLTIFDIGSNSNEFKVINEIKLFGEESPISVHSITIDSSGDTAIITLINNRIITINLSDLSFRTNDEEKSLIPPFHNGAILSCSTCCRRPLVATCGEDKTIRIWNYLDNSLEIIKEFQENIYSVSLHPDGLSILIGFGDKLKLFGIFYDDIRFIKDFSIRGCRCVKFSNGGNLFAAVNGSKIQIYSTLTFLSINTLHRHSAGVHSLIWGESDTVIASVGNDGAMYIHRQDINNRDENYTTTQIQYYSITSMPDFSSIFICGSDKSIKEIQNGQPIHDIMFPIQHTQLIMSNNGQMLFSGTKDGKIFSHSLPLGGERISLNCHTSSITSMSISFDDSLLFTTGEDGVLSIFNIRDKDNRIHTPDEKFFSGEVMTTKAEIEERSGQIRSLQVDKQDLETTFKMKKEMAEGNFKNQESEQRELAKKTKESWQVKHSNSKKIKDEAEMKSKSEITTINKKWNDKLAKLDEDNTSTIVKQHKECEELIKKKKEIEDDGISKLKKEEADYRVLLDENQKNHRENLEIANSSLLSIIKLKEEEIRNIKEMKEQIEYEYEKTKRETEKRLKDRFDQEALELTKIQDSIQKEVKDQTNKQKLSKLIEQEMITLTEELKFKIDKSNELEKQIKQISIEISQRKTANDERDHRISDLKKENQDLNKHATVQSFQEEKLRQQFAPIQKELSEIEKQKNLMDSQLELAHKRTSEQNELISEMQQKLKEVIENERKMTKRLMSSKSYFEQSKHDLHEVVQLFHSKDQLKKSFLQFYSKYVEKEKIEDIQLDEFVEEEHKRQKNTLQKQLTELRQQYSKDVQFQGKEQTKLLEQNASLIEELQRLRQENRTLNSSVILSRKGNNSNTFLPATEAQRIIEENKKRIAQLESQLSTYQEPRPISK